MCKIRDRSSKNRGTYDLSSFRSSDITLSDCSYEQSRQSAPVTTGHPGNEARSHHVIEPESDRP